jgi:hypothetical protein
MVWAGSIIVLVVVAVVTRKILGLSGPNPAPHLASADARRRLSRAVTLEIEAQSAILAISLNDAMEERETGQPELAWSTLHLMTSAQWVRLAETLGVLLNAVTRHLPLTRITAPARSLVPEFFRSEVMQGYLALHDSAEQFLFRGKPRFTLHVRALDQAVLRLTNDFLESQPGPLSLRDDDVWSRLDHDFHDFDLLSKETVLTVRGVIASLPANALDSFAAEILPALRRGVRSVDEYREVENLP